MRKAVASRHIKELCAELGLEYSIRMLDAEMVIYRSFGNGFDVEISGVNTESRRARAAIYLWDMRNGQQIVKRLDDVPQVDIGDRVNELLHGL